MVGHLSSARDRIVIGADPSCDIVVAGASPKHVVLERRSETMDVKAYAGEHVVHNSRPLGPMERQTVWPGDVLELGEVAVVVEPGGYAAPAPETQPDPGSPALTHSTLVALLEHVEAGRPKCADLIAWFTHGQAAAEPGPRRVR